MPRYRGPKYGRKTVTVIIDPNEEIYGVFYGDAEQAEKWLTINEPKFDEELADEFELFETDLLS